MPGARNSAPQAGRRKSTGDEVDGAEENKRRSALRRLSMRAFSKAFMNKKRLVKEARGAKSGQEDPVRDQFDELRAVQDAVKFYPRPLESDVDLIRYKGREPDVRDRMMRGESMAVPKDLDFEPNVVHLFVSSTFRDMRFERDCIVGLLEPRISKYCRMHGFKFQYQDMRWAITDRAHNSRDFSLQELERCKSRSLAFNFLGLIGNRYGFCPFPTQIEAEVFEKLVDEAANPDLLTTWFSLDENKLPLMYTLRHMSDVRGTSRNNRMAANNADWWVIFRELQQELRHAAQRLEIDDVLTEEKAKAFEQSVVDEEITEGILHHSDKHKTLLVIRELEGEGLEEDSIYYETEESDPDGYSLTRLNELKTACLDAIHENHRRVYEVPYEGGLDPVSCPAHSTYLRDLLTTLEEKIIGSIKHTLVNGIYKRDPVFEAVRMHAAHAALYAKSFVGRTELLHSIRSSRKRLVFVTGGAGSGKTYALSKICVDVADGVANRGRDNVVAARFLGATHDSTVTASLLRTLYAQLRDVYCGTDLASAPEIPVKPRDVRHAFLDFLSLATEDQPLMVVLDGIDQLSDGDYSWIPLSAKSLPPHVRLIVSARSASAPARAFHRSVQDKHEAVLVKMPAFLPEEVEEFLDAYLDAEGRVLRPRQKQSVLYGVNSLRDPSPLALRVLYEEARRLASWDPPLEHYASATEIDEIFAVWFARLEADHGLHFVQSALALITASHTGLEETELEDLLSLRDDLLAEAYTDFVPPLARFPQRRVIKLLTELRPFLWRGNWAHRELRRAALARYDGKMLSAYRALADYFGAESPAALERPVFKTEVNGEMWYLTQNRFPQAQPFRFETGAVNMRKFLELPGALQAVGDVDALEELVCSLKFIRIGLETSAADLIFWLRQPSSFRCSRIVQAVGQSLVAYESSPDHLEEILWLRLAPNLEPGDPLLAELNTARMRTPGLHALAPLRILQPSQPRRNPGRGGGSSFDSFETASASVAAAKRGKRIVKLRKGPRRTRHGSRANSRAGSHADSLVDSQVDSFADSQGNAHPASSQLGESMEDTQPSMAEQDDIEFRPDEAYSPENKYTLHGHTNQVTSVDTFEDAVTHELHIVSASAEGIRIWNAENKSLVSSIVPSQHHDGETSKVVAYVEPGGGARVVAGVGKNVVVYTLPAGEELRCIEDAHETDINAIGLVYQLDGTVDIVSANDLQICMWNGLNGQRKKLIQCEADAGPLVDLELFLDAQSNEWYALGIHLHEARVYSLDTGDRVDVSLTVETHGQEENAHIFRASVTYFHDGTVYALTCGDEDGSLRIWDVMEGVTVHMLQHDEHFNSPFTCVDVYEDAATDEVRCVTGDVDGVVKIWDPVAGKLLHIAEIHDGPVLDVTAYIDEEKEVWVVSAATDGQVVLSNHLPEVALLSSTASTRTLDNFGAAQALAAYTDGNRGWQVITVHGTQVAVMDPTTLVINMRWDSGANVLCVAVDDEPRSRHARCVVGLDSGLVAVWSIPSNKVLSVKAHKGQTLSVCVFDPRNMDANLVASSGEDGAVAVHNIETGDPICRWRAHDSAIHTLQSFSEERAPRLLSCDLDGNVRVWDFDKTRKVSSTVMSRKKPTPAQEIDNDSRVAAVYAFTEAHTQKPSIVLANREKVIRLINLNGSERKLRGHTGRILYVSSFSNPSSGKHCVVSASKDRTVRVWDDLGTLLTTYTFDQPIKALSTHRIPTKAFVIVSLRDGQLVALRFVDHGNVA
ncbi:NACHT domain- and WD repeat-containing protein 1 [Hondaea fermentalgiana]|uniref:NACHT domain-and WD repeat-containing protein 1 n=1 Tax=Hondaea fermentalgiana TaxID=2315210 RepID=A0A2R5GEH1_9STRA|nr:NACHT domain- and WD repeat-containing protein 1 [Hondaea fermentalgiana]|eukprot:GBG28965.1 NACHT domain- and WD repeat-containing protein 1 [Hondaea fermentalgiana]